MSGNRPFISNFLAAFRAHSATLASAPSTITSPTAVIASAQAAWSSSSAYAPPRLDTRKSTASQPAKEQPTSAQTATAKDPQTTAASTVSTVYYPHAPLQHTVSPLTHGRSPPSPTNPVPTQPQQHQRGRTLQQFPTCQEAKRNRRGSDTSSEGGMGFRNTSRAADEKWYIGGRTAGGEERFYRLAMVTRDRSADRLSADRMSL